MNGEVINNAKSQLLESNCMEMEDSEMESSSTAESFLYGSSVVAFSGTKRAMDSDEQKEVEMDFCKRQRLGKT